ncbi:hypothetical protein K503DRAFT_869718 [Rhizopogon vinicolor AM-OR11-026]|uniref:DUF6533 domain-containing protein n=1 Tax=Rhizopogon vinicolor AM-OR11-026 TaxID=1314800 RepID=A0A1B7MKQ8_9AGAM|nr:hypothetical protein K503DRAFT_869718 [Rhizopogon vinicolor AM-OR11-026]
MTTVSNDPSLWPIMSDYQEFNYFEVACLTAVVYDWALTFGQEFELVWRQRWSLMTFLYFNVRYIGISYIAVNMLSELPSVSLTDASKITDQFLGSTNDCISCTILYFMPDWIGIVVDIMLGVIIIARLYAMYQRSRQMLIFLVVTFLAIRIPSVVLSVIQIRHISGEEYVLSGAHVCRDGFQGDAIFLIEITWILTTAWESLALFLAVWTVVKHFRELQRPSSGWTVGDCFTILIKTHVFYFTSYAAVSSLQLINFSQKLNNSTSVAAVIFAGILEFTRCVQIFILGPRLILGVREYHANLVANSDEGTGMGSIVFRERVHISTGSGV